MAWNGSDRRASVPSVAVSAGEREVKSRSRKTIPLRGLMAGLAVVLGASGIILYFAADGEVESPTERRQARPKVESPRKASASKGQQTTDKAKPEMPQDVRPKEVLVSAQTNGTGHILERIVGEDGKPIIRVREMPSIWQFHTDGLLAQIVRMAEDEDTPPFPPMDEYTERTFLKSLETPLAYDKNDSYEVRCLKMVVSSLRAEIKELMDAGEKFADILEEDRKLVNHNNRIRGNARREYDAIVESGDIKGAEEYKSTVNEFLNRMGIEAIGESEDDEGDS